MVIVLSKTCLKKINEIGTIDNFLSMMTLRFETTTMACESVAVFASFGRILEQVGITPLEDR